MAGTKPPRNVLNMTQTERFEISTSPCLKQACSRLEHRHEWVGVLTARQRVNE